MPRGHPEPSAFAPRAHPDGMGARFRPQRLDRNRRRPVPRGGGQGQRNILAAPHPDLGGPAIGQRGLHDPRGVLARGVHARHSFGRARLRRRRPVIQRRVHRQHSTTAGRSGRRSWPGRSRSHASRRTSEPGPRPQGKLSNSVSLDPLFPSGWPSEHLRECRGDLAIRTSGSGRRHRRASTGGFRTSVAVLAG